MLVLTNIQIVYDRSILAVRDLSLTVSAGSIFALLGPNGVGKSTTLKAISGVLRHERGELVHGSLSFNGVDLRNEAPDKIVDMGIVQVPEGRRLFVDLTVEENLLTGAARRPTRELSQSLAEVYAWFPRLVDKRKISAGYLSGGEQQMVAIGRALMAKPKILLLDEPSLGLAPQIVDQIFSSLQQLRQNEGLTILLVEQNAVKALGVADEGCIVEDGKVSLQGKSADLIVNDRVRHSYLGLSDDGQRRSFKEADVQSTAPSKVT